MNNGIITFDLLKDSYKRIVIDTSRTNRYMMKGSKMYVAKMEDLIDVLTKKELKTFIQIIQKTECLTYANILKCPFISLVPDIDKYARSKFKKKLLDNGIMMKYNGKLIINPFILVPRDNKNIKNFQYLVQRTWKYLHNDKDAYIDGLDIFINELFE